MIMKPNLVIRYRIEALCAAKGKSWLEVYSSMEWHKSYASRVLNGRILPKIDERIKLCRALGVEDFTAIWNEPFIINAYELEQQEKASQKQEVSK